MRNCVKSLIVSNKFCSPGSLSDIPMAVRRPPTLNLEGAGQTNLNIKYFPDFQSFSVVGRKFYIWYQITCE